MSRRDGQTLKPVLDIYKNVYQGHVFSSEVCEALNAEVSRRYCNVHGKRSFHIRTQTSAERIRNFLLSINGIEFQRKKACLRLGLLKVKYNNNDQSCA